MDLDIVLDRDGDPVLMGTREDIFDVLSLANDVTGLSVVHGYSAKPEDATEYLEIRRRSA